MKLEAGQLALVTGASRGLGVEIARQLAARSLNIILAARSKPDLERVAADLRAQSGAKIDTYPVDLSDTGALQSLARFAAGADILVNNAGIEGAMAYDERAADEIVDTIAINLTAPMLLTHALLPHMIARRKGHIVNVASMGGLVGMGFNEPYSATKFGLVGFTRALRMTAQAQNWGVSASAICPGFVDSDGMFEALKKNYGIATDDLDVAPLTDVGKAVVDAIEQDLPDVLVTNGDPRQLIAMCILEPRKAEMLLANSPAAKMFAGVAASRSPAK